MKELVYKVEWVATCELELVLRKGDQVSYKYEEGKSMKENKIEVKKLLEKAKQPHSGVTSENTLSAYKSGRERRHTPLRGGCPFQGPRPLRGLYPLLSLTTPAPDHHDPTLC